MEVLISVSHTCVECSHRWHTWPGEKHDVGYYCDSCWQTFLIEYKADELMGKEKSNVEL